MRLISFRPLSETWEHEREFLLFDVCALSLSALCLRHALRSTSQLALYLSILFGGAIIDLTIRKIPQLASFWQAQNWLELLDYSEPAYILFGMYAIFQYPAISLARNLQLDWVGETAASALFATVVYHPYDIVGAKYVWWLWHRDDPLMVPASMGVPVASTFWTMAYTGALAGAFRVFASTASLQRWGVVRTAALVAPIASLVLMNAPFCLFYQPLVLGLGLSEGDVLNLFRVFCALLTVYALWTKSSRKEDENTGAGHTLLLAVPMLHFAALAAIVVAFDPAEVRRHGLWQTYGNCDTREIAYFGWLERSKYNCDEASGRNALLWDFRCLEKLPQLGAQWYTVCPLPFPDGWLTFFGAHLAVGVVVVVGAYLAAARLEKRRD